MYAIVDIETTGGYAAANGITEICIKLFDGEKVVESFETLINPQQYISRYIQAFTNISNEMVATAPLFETVAEKVYTLLQGNVFVAHNVNFDYSFIKHQLERCGYTLQAKKLCTVRLARQIFPGLKSYGLGNLCQSLSIAVSNRHRAGGDATATVMLFKMLLDNDDKSIIETSLQRASKEALLPPHLSKAHFNALPFSPGIYYFHDQKGNIIYVGKAKNIRSRVNSHFSNNSAGRQKQNFIQHTHSISYKATATELMAAILESTEIKRLWPRFNVSQKKPEELFGIFMYEDQNGYMRLAIEKKRRNSNPVYTFHYKVDGHGVLRKLMKQFVLCPKLCFMQTSTDACIGIAEAQCHGACEKTEPADAYNQRVLQAIASVTHQPTYAVMDKGLTEEDISCIMVVKGNFFGMGYLPKNVDVLNPESIQPYITPYKDNSTIRVLLNSFVQTNPASIKMFDSAPSF